MQNSYSGIALMQVNVTNDGPLPVYNISVGAFLKDSPIIPSTDPIYNQSLAYLYLPHKLLNYIISDL